METRLQIKKWLIFLNPDSLALVALTALYSTVSYVQWSSNCTSTWCTCCIVRMACMSPQGERGLPSGVCCRVELRRGVTPLPSLGGSVTVWCVSIVFKSPWIWGSCSIYVRQAEPSFKSGYKNEGWLFCWSLKEMNFKASCHQKRHYQLWPWCVDR